MRELANNIKHFASPHSDEIHATSNGNKTWEEITCTWENMHIQWDYTGLIIITKENQWVSALDVFQKIYDYWVNFFKTFFADCI